MPDVEGAEAQLSGLGFSFLDIEGVQATANQLPKKLIFIPALLLLGLVAMLQSRRATPIREGEMA